MSWPQEDTVPAREDTPSHMDSRCWWAMTTAQHSDWVLLLGLFPWVLLLCSRGQLFSRSVQEDFVWSYIQNNIYRAEVLFAVTVY